MLALPLLWAVFDDNFKHMVLAGITRRIKEAYDMLPRRSMMVENPVTKGVAGCHRGRGRGSSG
eukprot:1605818-Ditylum_brightwellii.AAC.1